MLLKELQPVLKAGNHGNGLKCVYHRARMDIERNHDRRSLMFVRNSAQSLENCDMPPVNAVKHADGRNAGCARARGVRVAKIPLHAGLQVLLKTRPSFGPYYAIGFQPLFLLKLLDSINRIGTDLAINLAGIAAGIL